MKNRMLVFGLALCMGLVLTGCQKPADQQFLETIEYSNVVGPAVQKELAEVMSDAGISEERQRVFFNHVDQFNSAVSPEGLAEGFEQSKILETSYDSYKMQEEWEAAHPDFLGYNCRITAYGLFGDFVEIPSGTEARDDMVLLDLAALEEDPSVLLDGEDLDRFKALYSTVPTEQSKDISVHVKALQKDWQDRGIVFDEQSQARLITVVFHEDAEEGSYLFIGHAGVLLPVSEHEWYFVEKVAFQEPYRLIKFQNRVELNDYLMAKYDVSSNQPTAAPFIMENDALLEGYRSYPSGE